jgi:hypothetical protein
MTAIVRENSNVLRAFERQIARGFEIEVGILSKGTQKHAAKAAKAVKLTAKKVEKQAKELTIAYLASIHEFGLGVEERSFIRGWFDAEQDAILKVITDRVLWALRKNKPLLLAAQQAAVKLAAMCQARMVGGWTYKDISDETKRRKKSNTPLIDTGVLKSAIAGDSRLK